MKKFIFISILLSICLFFLCLSPDINSDSFARADENIPKITGVDIYQGGQSFYAPEEIIVDFKDNTTMSHIEKLERDFSIDLKFNSIFSRDERIMTALVGEYRMSGILKKLKRDNSVEYAEPNYYYHILTSKPNDPLYKYQWHLEKINVRKAWDRTRGEGVIVAVIDTGVAYEDYGKFHRVEDLEKTNFVRGYNFVDKNNHPNDDHAHGTHVAGTIAQTTNNRKGVAGIAYKSRIMPLKVLSANGYGKVSDIADAVRYAADHGAKVINMSLGGPFPSSVLKSACDYAYKKGVVIVCAAGNSRSRKIGYPAAYSSCLAVSATRFDDKLAPYSNRGKDIDIAAPGGDLRVDQNKDGMPDGVLQNTIKIKDPEKEGYYLFQGTSMACPHVAGAAALVASTGVTGNKEIISILKKSARKKGINLPEGYGAGILDAGAAVNKSTIDLGWIKLIIAIVVLIIIIVIIGMKDFRKYAFSPLLLIGWLMGSTGLFFLYYTKAASFPGVNLLTRGIPEWDCVIFGPGAHINPLFYSVLIPFIIGVILYKTRWQKLAAGLSLGFAAQILFAITRSADVHWIPGTFVLDKGWLILNFVLAMILGYALIKLNGKKEKS
ncbi:MAG: S8 family peptidase [Candidatus Eremiobacteraeota bacterium]|nr:S8 family peptidase [Candidatus Eremiobacteraeota bacterium]